MRMGTADLDSIHSPGGIERRVVDINFHPKYKPGQVYFDVGIAVAGEIITFNDFIRPVCLPYLPVDYNDHLSDNFVTLGGWGYAIQARTGFDGIVTNLVELTSNLKLRSLKVSNYTIFGFLKYFHYNTN